MFPTRYRAGSIQGVVVSTLNRLSRIQTHLVILMGEMEEHGCTLHSVNEHIDDTAARIFLRFILGVVAEIEQEKALNTPIKPRPP